MATIPKENFKIPDGYVEEEIGGQLYLEELDEDSELWLIRVPSHIEFSSLDKKKIYVGSDPGDVFIKTIKTGNDKVLEFCAENCDFPNMRVVLPERNSNKLQTVNKIFKGSINVCEGLDLNNETEIKNEIDETSQTAGIDNIPNLNHETKQKNSKKGKRHSRNSENYETEDADNGNFPARKHKHSKKRSQANKSNENMEIKSEPESYNSDDFPMCQSQN